MKCEVIGCEREFKSRSTFYRHRKREHGLGREPEPRQRGGPLFRSPEWHELPKRLLVLADSLRALARDVELVLEQNQRLHNRAQEIASLIGGKRP